METIQTLLNERNGGPIFPTEFKAFASIIKKSSESSLEKKVQDSTFVKL